MRMGLPPYVMVVSPVHSMRAPSSQRASSAYWQPGFDPSVV